MDLSILYNPLPRNRLKLGSLWYISVSAQMYPVVSIELDHKKLNISCEYALSWLFCFEINIAVRITDISFCKNNDLLILFCKIKNACLSLPISVEK